MRLARLWHRRPVAAPVQGVQLRRTILYPSPQRRPGRARHVLLGGRMGVRRRLYDQWWRYDWRYPRWCRRAVYRLLIGKVRTCSVPLCDGEATYKVLGVRIAIPIWVCERHFVDFTKAPSVASYVEHVPGRP